MCVCVDVCMCLYALVYICSLTGCKAPGMCVRVRVRVHVRVRVCV